jgi:hypothetical protein
MQSKAQLQFAATEDRTAKKQPFAPYAKNIFSPQS